MAKDIDAILAANRAVGRIELTAAVSGEATRRTHVHEAGALRARFPHVGARELEVVLINTAGGMAGGDAFDLSVTARDRAEIVVTSAAAEKIYRSLGPDTRIGISLNVGPEAALAWLPQETILFDRARLTRTIDIALAKDARIVLAEAVVFGRSGMGEVVAQGKLLERWRLRREGRLVFADGIRFEGPVATKLDQRAMTAGAIAIATVLVAPADERLAQSIRELAQEGLCGELAVSVWNGHAVTRLAAPDGAALRHDLIRLLTAVRSGGLPRLWLN